MKEKKDEISIDKVTYEFSQNGDSCQDNVDNAQSIKIETENAGAGDYYVISTERWAFDDIKSLVKLIRKIKLQKEKK